MAAYNGEKIINQPHIWKVTLESTKCSLLLKYIKKLILYCHYQIPYGLLCLSSIADSQDWRSSSAAVAWEKLIKNVLQRFVDCHGVIFAQVVPASWTGVHLGSKGALETFLAHIVLTLSGDWLEDHFLAANANKNFFNFSQEFRSKWQWFHGFIPKFFV